MKRLKNQDRPYTPAEVQAVVDGYRNGVRPAAIAEALGRSRSSVKNKAWELRKLGRIVPRSNAATLEKDAGPVPGLTDFSR